MDDRHLGYTKNIQTFDRKFLPEEKTFAPPTHRPLHVEISQRRNWQIARKGFAILARIPREIVAKFCISERRRHRLTSPLI
jgi:hypothetical protein